MKEVKLRTLLYRGCPIGRSIAVQRRPRERGGANGPLRTVAAASASQYLLSEALAPLTKLQGINNIDLIPDEGFGDNIHDPTGRSGS